MGRCSGTACIIAAGNLPNVLVLRNPGPLSSMQGGLLGACFNGLNFLSHESLATYNGRGEAAFGGVQRPLEIFDNAVNLKNV
jgi:hypothetical protein